jgi:hypothetical protein
MVTVLMPVSTAREKFEIDFENRESCGVVVWSSTLTGIPPLLSTGETMETGLFG